MTKEAIIKQTVSKMNQLPDDKVREISNFISFIFHQFEESLLTKGIQKMTEESQAFDFLNKEEELYTVEDLKEVYNG
ncbi:MAG TPA: hypothetical protein PLL71_01145 [Agriterribacter sp.]|nr:hypothetical protein [Agriterribacter sp.]HRQ49081.1 hypothetical protein [Agriterribacter sp.]